MLDCELDAAFAIYWHTLSSVKPDLNPQESVIEWARRQHPENLKLLTQKFERACKDVLCAG